MLAHKIVATRSSTDKPQNLDLSPKFIERQRDVGWLKMVYHFSGNTEVWKITKSGYFVRMLMDSIALIFSKHGCGK